MVYSATERVFMDPANAIHVSILLVLGGLFMGIFGILALLLSLLAGFAPFIPTTTLGYGSVWHIINYVSPFLCMWVVYRRSSRWLEAGNVVLLVQTMANLLLLILLVVDRAQDLLAPITRTGFYGLFVSILFFMGSIMSAMASSSLANHLRRQTHDKARA